jgi:hypothetical protein
MIAKPRPGFTVRLAVTVLAAAITAAGLPAAARADRSVAPAAESTPGGQSTLRNKQIDPCAIASADVLKALLQNGIQPYFPLDMDNGGRHIDMSRPSVEQVSCPHMSIKVQVDIQYRQTRGLLQGESGGSLAWQSPLSADLAFASVAGALTITASNLREATAALSSPQIISLKIDHAPGWLEPAWIGDCLNGRHAEWGCRDVLTKMKFNVTRLVQSYLQQGYTL